jgi:hypothetical protein
MGQDRTLGAHLSRQLHFVGHAISVKTENQAVLVGERWTVEVQKFVRRRQVTLPQPLEPIDLDRVRQADIIRIADPQPVQSKEDPLKNANASARGNFG